LATPAAILSIIVEANTRSATTDLRKFDTQLKRIDKTGVTATARTATLGKTSQTAGRHLASAARYAAGAAAAYLSISQAKAAVTTTSDLAKVTSGLNRNLGLSIKTASQWGAVAKSRDVDAKSLTLSFTTLSRRLVDTADALKAGGASADSAFEPFRRLGLSQQEVVAGSKDLGSFLPTLANAFGDAAGGAERQASAQELLGRGYQSILPLFASGAKGLREQQEWADKYGATLDSKTVKAQMALVQAQRESKVAVLGLQVSFAKFLAPALERANELFQRVAKIVGSDKLTSGEKFEKLGKIIGKWADKAYQAFREVLPKIITAVGNKVPEIAKAFVEGFLAAGIWGKLAIGGWLFAKFGGMSAFASMGSKGGTAFGKNFAKSAGPMIAALLAAEYGDDIGRKLSDAIHGNPDEIEANSKRNEGLKQQAILIERLTKKIGDHKADLRVLSDLNGETVENMRRDIAKLPPSWTRTVDRLDSTLGSSARDFASWREDISRYTEDVEGDGDKLERKMRQTFRSVGLGAGSLANAVGKALGNIGDNTNSLLRGLKVGQVSFGIEKASKAVNGLQRGGPINLGAPSGDSVPAMLERGEYVLNRNAVAAIGKQQLDAINFGAAARFQVGGMAGLEPGISRLVNWAADRYGLRVSSGLRSSDTDSLHSRGWAADLVPPGMAATRGIFATFKNQLEELFYDPWGGYDSGQMIGPIGGHMDHIHAAIAGGGSSVGASKVARWLLTGPDGPWKKGGQGMLDKAGSAANAYLRQHAGHGSLGLGNVKGSLQGIAKRLVSEAWGSGQWPYFNDLVMRESGWDPSAVNPSSGAAGLAQALPASKYPPGAWPYTGKSSAVKQLQWMVDYIAGRYGNPAGAIAFHDANNWYQHGGMVHYLSGGGQPGKAKDWSYKPPPTWDATGSATKPGFISAAQAAKVAKQVQDRMAGIARLDEQIDLAQRIAALPTSEAGSDLGKSELSQQLSLNQGLLGNLVETRNLSAKGLSLAQSGLKRAKGPNRKSLSQTATTLSETLESLQGLTGKGGRIFDTQMLLSELGSTASAPKSVQGISFTQLLDIAKATSFGVFDRMPVMHQGGIVPGPRGADVAIMAQAGERVIPANAPDEFEAELINWDSGIVRFRRIANEQYDQREAQSNLAMRAGITR
jgi:hypothetical protein